MKQYTVYVCETCGYENRDVDEMRKHEAAHLGLTVKEMDEYRALKSFASYMGSVISKINNEETQQKFDKAIEAVIDFEKRHSIRNKFTNGRFLISVATSSGGYSYESNLFDILDEIEDLYGEVGRRVVEEWANNLKEGTDDEYVSMDGKVHIYTL